MKKMLVITCLLSSFGTHANDNNVTDQTGSPQESRSRSSSTSRSRSSSINSREDVLDQESRIRLAIFSGIGEGQATKTIAKLDANARSKSYSQMPISLILGGVIEHPLKEERLEESEIKRERSKSFSQTPSPQRSRSNSNSTKNVIAMEKAIKAQFAQEPVAPRRQLNKERSKSFSQMADILDNAS